jgi:hypothetical protein
MRRLIWLTLLLALFLPSAKAANTYYIDSVAGSDANTSTQAQSKSTPWQHVPGMLCATGAAASYSIQAGDQFIVKGGSVYHNSCFMMNTVSGNSTTSTYYGVDKTWYNGGSFTRPIMNGDLTLIPNNNGQMFNVNSYVTIDNWEITGYYWGTQPTGTYSVSGTAITCTASCTGTGAFTAAMAGLNITVGVSGSSATACDSAYVSTFNSSTSLTLNTTLTARTGSTGSCTTIANASLVFRNLHTYANQGASGDFVIFEMNQRSGQLVENLYVHGWAHAGTNAATSAGTATAFIGGGGFGTDTLHDTVVSGADTAGDYSLQTAYSWPAIAYNNYVTNAMGWNTSNTTSFHDNFVGNYNEFYCNDPFPTFSGNCNHENGFEDNGSQNLAVYNNTLTNINAGLVFWIAPYPAYTANVFNNLVYNIGGGANILDIPAPPVYNGAGTCPSGTSTIASNYCNEAGTYNFVNNTVECGTDTSLSNCQGPVGNGSAQGFTVQSMNWKNNHTINNTNAAGGCYTGSYQPVSCTYLNNINQTLAVANGQGYTSGQTYPFSPTSGGSTIVAGANLTSLASGNAVALANDTTLACSDVSNVPTCPTRTTNQRPSGTPWDSGAYMFSSGTPTAGTPTFSPVAGTYTSTQNVTITSTGATIICYNNTAASITIGGAASCPAGSTLYTSPVAVNSTQTLYAVAGGVGYLDSALATAAYTINLPTFNIILNGNVTLKGAVVLP